jgi:hypothetical protein
MRHKPANDIRKTIKTLIAWQHEMRQRPKADRHAMKVIELRITNLTTRRRAGDNRPETQDEIDAAIETVKSLGL